MQNRRLSNVSSVWYKEDLGPGNSQGPTVMTAAFPNTPLLFLDCTERAGVED